MSAKAQKLVLAKPLQTTVVIPCWNSAAFVSGAIESCLSEGVPEQQVICVDDGSTDDTPNMLKAWANRVKVLRKNNGGAPSARNAGLREATTEYVVFLDADDLYDGGILGALEFEMLRQDADLGFAAQVVVKAGTRKGHRKTPPCTDNSDRFLSEWLGGATVGTNSHMWRTEFLRRIGGWREDMKRLEEIEVVVRAVLAGAVLAVSETGQALYIDQRNAHRVSHGNSETIIRSVVEGLSAIEPELRTASQRRALGGRFYREARSAFRQGHVELGREALDRARICGFRGHIGTRGHQFVARILGLEIKERWARRCK